MKKAITAIMVAIFVMGLALIAEAGLKDIPDAGNKGSAILTGVERLKATRNIVCPKITALESATGVDIKAVTDNKVLAYFDPIPLAAAEILAYKKGAVALDLFCEFYDTLDLPATDN
jgi:hypothetical protein